MDTASNELFLFRWIQRMVFRLVFWLSGWLDRHASGLWREIVEKRPVTGGARPLPGVAIAFPEPFKRESLESLDGRGSHGDAPRLAIEAVQHLQNAPRLLIEEAAETGEPIVLPAWAKEIGPFLANQLSAHTRRAYETDLKQFFVFMEGRIPTDSLATLRPEHIILYRKYLEEGRLTGRPMEKTTINRKLAVVKSFLNWLRANQVIRENPAQLVKGFPQSQESTLVGLSDEEAKRMLALPNPNKRSGALHAAILYTLLFLGLRKGELIGLKMGDLDEDRGIPILRVRGKGHRVRVLPLTKTVKAAIEHYLFACRRERSDKEAPLFTPTKNPRTKETMKPMNPNAITYIVLRYARKAGILKKISPHSCRATCISNALDKRATHRSVQHLAGWSTPLMIQRYDKRREELQNSAAFAVDYGVEAPPAADAATEPAESTA